MRIQTLVNFKLRNGHVMLKGTYDDSQSKFPPEIYEEIEMIKSGQTKTTTLRVLEENPVTKTTKPSPKVAPEETVETMDTGVDALETAQQEAESQQEEEKPKKSTSRRKTPRKSTSKKKTEEETPSE